MRGERHQELREVEIGRERHKRLEVMGEKRAKGFKKLDDYHKLES